MTYKIERLSNEFYEKAHSFQCEYLDQEDYSTFSKRVNNDPDLYLIAKYKDELAGLCYGHANENDNLHIHLQGIAVDLDKAKGIARKGIGSALLKSFEDTARDKGYRLISLGAADNEKVEAFYLKNGYIAYELVAKDGPGIEYAREPINGYLEGKLLQKNLREKYKPREVIFIFKKDLY